MADRATLLHPRDGDIVNRHDGVLRPDSLLLRVDGEAPPGREVTVTVAGEQGRPGQSVLARRDGDRFTAELPLSGHRSVVSASCDGSEDRARILWDSRSFPRYRFSIDDNILFLKDLARGDHRSLFDHWYLAFWRGIHQRYGTKVHINVYYQTDDSVFSGPRFQLPEMPDRFKGEWRDNADWLHLSFHARQNKPDRPYKAGTYEQLATDFEAVMEQIRRFAGDEVTSNFTTVHWAEAPLPGVKALHDRGISGFIGLFDQGRPDAPCGYYLDAATAAHVAKRDYWWDPDEDIQFVSCDSVVNGYALDAVLPRLEHVAESPHTSEVIELLIHEQYFRSELAIFQPDVQQKVVRAVEWVSERGYKPVFYSEGFIGA
ncbi:MAG: hypothetical protein ACYC5O_19950 [Anaerolineae bacterium]